MKMKKLLTLFLALAMAVGMSGIASAEDGSTDDEMVCEQCGGAPIASSYQKVDDEYHVSVCEHGKIVPDSKETHHNEITYNDDEHWYVCRDCGYESEHQAHQASCLAPVCLICNKSMPSVGEHDYEVIAKSERSHRLSCKRCGSMVEVRHPSSGVCEVCGYGQETTPGGEVVCEQCGGAPIPAGYQKVDDEYHVSVCEHGVIVPDSKAAHHNEIWYNDSEHRFVCSDCGYASVGEHDYIVKSVTDSVHVLFCTRCERLVQRMHYLESGVCTTCGYEMGTTPGGEVICEQCGGAPIPAVYKDLEGTTKHVSVCAHGVIVPNSEEEHTFERGFDKKEHFDYCTECGSKWNSEEHYAYCIDQTKCAVCGQPYAGNDVQHGNSSLDYNETEHWWVCDLCGDDFNHEAHYSDCVNRGYCYQCGYETSAIKHWHPSGWEIDSDTYTITETTHSYDCACDDYVTEEHDFYEGKCVYCGYVKSTEPTTAPEPTTTATPEPTATATPEPTSTATPEPTASEEPTATPVPTESTEPSVSPAPTYELIEEGNTTWTPNAPDSDGTLTFHVDAEFEKFTGVMVDGNVVPEDMYTAVPGSTIVTLKPEYLATLPAGEHTLTIGFEDGVCATGFTIAKTSETQAPAPTKKPEGGNGDVNIPKTGDTNSMTVWYVLMFVSVAVAITTAVVSKKRKYNR